MASAPRLWTLPILLGLAAAAVLVQALLLYFDAFRIAPSGDDGDLIAYIGEGRAHGWSWFFLQQKVSSFFRPAKHCIVWLLGLAVETHRDVAYRTLHFAFFALYVLALCLWLKWASLSRRATLIAIAVFLVHPALVATLSSIDGFGGIMATTMTWLGVLAAVRFVDRPLVAVPAVVAAFAVGCVFKEYVLALLPLAVIATFVFAEKNRWRHSLTMAAVLGVAFAGYMFWRSATMPAASDAGSNFVTRSPVTLATNVVLAGVGAFYPGDTIPIALHRSPVGIAGLGALTLIAFGLLCGGLWLAFRANVVDRRRLVFLLIAFAGSTFPCILHSQHFAEKYVAAMLLPLALLAAIAVDGWETIRRSQVRWLAAGLAILIACTSAIAVRHKNHEMRSLGERSTHMAMQVASAVPDIYRKERLLIVFLNSELADQKGYSIYCMRDDILLAPGSYAFEWWFPRSQMANKCVRVDTLDAIGPEERASYDRILVWHADTKTVSPLDATIDPSR